MKSDQPADTGKADAASADAFEAYDAPGSVLARARSARGLKLEDVAGKLKFGTRQLEALEGNRFDSLPRGTFLRGMVRSYARLLELDPEPLLAQIADQIDLPDAEQLATRYSEPVPFSDAGKRLNVVYAVLSAAVLLVAAAVAFEWESSRNKPQQPVAQAAPGAKPPPVEAVDPKRTPAAEEARVELPAPELRTASIASASVATGQPAAPKAARELPKAGDAGKVLRFRFDRESWVQVRDGAGHLLMSQINPQGTESTVEGNPPFSLVIGNAQHVKVVYQNEPIDLAPHIKVEVARFTLP